MDGRPRRGWLWLGLAAAACALVFGPPATAVPEVALHGKVVVAKVGNGEGRVTSTPDGIDCGPNCSHSFISNDDPENYQPVELSGKAEPGSAFEGFGECGTVCTIDPVEPGKTYEVTATFVRSRPAQFSLVVTLSGSGTVRSQPGGIDCGSKCSAPFATDSSVTLSATPTPGWAFTGWSGACTGTGACSVGMGGPRAVTATFAPPNTVYAMAIATAGGTVTSDVPGISCGEACVASFGAGVHVTLTPSSSPVQWGGACSGSGACVVPMARARAVTASIAGAPLARAPLAVSVTGKGSVTSSPAGIACGTACGVVLPRGVRMTLSAVPEPGWVFAGWSGSCRGVSRSCALTAKTAASVLAAYVEAGTRFPVAITKVGQGRVTSRPPGINCGGACSRPFPAGSKVTIEATPRKGWTFVRWSGACKGKKPACVLQLDAAKAASATFGRRADPTPPRVKALASSGELGKVVQLRYRVVEASGRSRETATVFRGARRLATISGPLHAVESDALFYFLPWRSTARGELRFCVVSSDASGNRSTRSCAALDVT
ncbi:MAG TPA: hypothetical protein VFR32_11110 [Gaiellaceae bacterium]|nr:hypothetical protein [Gaiellaceae bacterium]